MNELPTEPPCLSRCSLHPNPIVIMDADKHTAERKARRMMETLRGCAACRERGNTVVTLWLAAKEER